MLLQIALGGRLFQLLDLAMLYLYACDVIFLSTAYTKIVKEIHRTDCVQTSRFSMKFIFRMSTATHQCVRVVIGAPIWLSVDMGSIPCLVAPN